VEEDEHFLTLYRYMGGNALTTGVVERAEDWRWGSLWARRRGHDKLKAILSQWPVARPRKWVALVNQPMREKGGGEDSDVHGAEPFAWGGEMAGKASEAVGVAAHAA
jgi:hypothetical protein